MTDIREFTPLVSVIIVTYNSRSFVEHCLDSVITCGYPSIEVIVVDNNSKDGTADFVGVKYPGVILVRNTTNMRFSNGINIGITKSHGRLIFLLNPDAWIERDCIQELVKTASKGTKIGVIGCKILSPNRFLESLGGTIRVSGRTHLIGNGKPDSKIFTVPREVDWVSGAAMMITRNVIEQLGLLDPFYYFYYEETDFCWRAHKASFKVCCSPTAVAFHHGGRSSHDESWNRYLQESRVVFVLTNYPFSYLVYWAVLELRGFLLLLASHAINRRKNMMNLLMAYWHSLHNLVTILRRRISRRGGSSWLPIGFARSTYLPATS